MNRTIAGAEFELRSLLGAFAGAEFLNRRAKPAVSLLSRGAHAAIFRTALVPRKNRVSGGGVSPSGQIS